MKGTSRDLIDLQQKMVKLTKIEEEILEQKTCKVCCSTKDEISTIKQEIKNIKAEHEILKKGLEDAVELSLNFWRRLKLTEDFNEKI